MSLPTTPKVVGSTIAWEGNRNGSWSPTNGATTIIPKSGTNVDEFNNLIASLQSSRTAFSWNFDGKAWTIYAQYGGDASDPESPTTELPIVPTFEVHPKTIQVDLLDSKNPNVLAVHPVLIQNMKQAVRDGSSPSFLTPNYRINGQLVNPTDRWNAAYLYFRYTQGLKLHTYYGDILRKTYTISTGQNLADTQSNVGKVLSTSTLISSERINSLDPSLANSLRPSQTIRTGFQFPYSNTVTQTGVAIVHQGWLKSGIYVNTVDATKRQVTVEYEYGDWDDYEHGQML